MAAAEKNNRIVGRAQTEEGALERPLFCFAFCQWNYFFFAVFFTAFFVAFFAAFLVAI